MTRSKTKRALLASVMALVLCLAMLIGTTFAWFTDSTSTGVNKIQAGTLDIELQMKDPAAGEWVSAEGQMLDFVKAEGAEDEDILWEPNCTYDLQELRLVNNSNLALKYKVIITGIKGDAELNDVIDWTIKLGDSEDQLVLGEEMTWLPTDTAEQAFTISGHMQDTAGNYYQGKSIEGIAITVLAAQAPVESDSINNQYDAGAEYAAASSSDLTAMLENAQPGETVVISSDFEGSVIVPADVKDITIAAADGAKVDKIVLDQDGIDNITFEGFSFDKTAGNDISVKICENLDIGEVNFNNCTFTGSGRKVTDGLSGKNTNADIVFENCKFIDMGRPVYDEFGGFSSLTLRGCTFDNSASVIPGSETMSWVATMQGHYTTAVIDGCTFISRLGGIAKMSGGCDNFTFTNNTLVDCGDHPSRGLFEGTPSNITWENNTFNGEPFENYFN